MPFVETAAAIVLGGVLSIGSATYLEQRKAAREQQRDENVRRGALERAARLIADELLRCRSVLAVQLAAPDHLVVPATWRPPMTAWELHQGELTGSADAWSACCSAYASLYFLSVQGDPRIGDAAESSAADFLRAALSEIDAATGRLLALTGTHNGAQPPISRNRAEVAMHHI